MSQIAEEDNYNDKEHEAKIALIQTELMDKQLSAEQFSLFLKKKKGKETIFLSEFSIEELHSYLSDFKQTEGKVIENGGLQTINSFITATDSSLSYYNDNDNYITSIKQTKGILSDYEHLTIIISNPIKVSTFFFFGVDYQFTIEVAELSSKVMRTFSDFEFLKDTLEQYYPTTYIPPLPKMPFIPSSEENYLKRKANYLLMFLNTLTQNPLIMSTQLFLDFLQTTKENFDKVKSLYDETDPPTALKKFSTLEGLINVNVEAKNEEFLETIKGNLLSKENQYKKLNVALKDLLNEFNVISEKMTKVSIAFGDIALVHQDIPFVQQTYLNFEELTKRYANSYLNQQLVFKEDIQQYFKYTCNNLTQFSSILNDVNAKKANFEYADVTPEKKCQLNKREQKLIDHLLKTYGYCLNKTVAEYQRLLTATSDAMRNHLQDINSKREKLFGDYLSMASLLEIKNEDEVRVV